MFGNATSTRPILTQRSRRKLWLYWRLKTAATWGCETAKRAEINEPRWLLWCAAESAHEKACCSLFLPTLFDTAPGTSQLVPLQLLAPNLSSICQNHLVISIIVCFAPGDNSQTHLHLGHPSETMSGAVESMAGLTLSAVSIAALFTTCVDCFNIILNARDFGLDYELLCTELSLQKLRLFLWGESVGLASRQGILHTTAENRICSVLIASATGNPGPYNTGLDDPILKPTIAQTLRAIEFLLCETQKYDEKYTLKENEASTPRRLRSLSVFKSTFDKFSENARKNQKQKSVLTVTRWAVFDADQFEKKIARLRGLIDGLESVTRALGTLEEPQTLLQEEISLMTDTRSLELVRDASSIRDVSETASRRLSLLDEGTLQSRKIFTTSTSDRMADNDHSFRTALSHLGPPSETDQFINAEEEDLAELQAHLRAIENGSMPTHNQRVMAYRWNNYQPKFEKPSFGSTQSLGQHLRPIWEEDRAKIEHVCGSITDKSDNRIRRIAKEMKDIYRWAPFFSFAPICDDITHALASMEGPPGTPYDSGIFWLYLVFPQQYPFRSPLVRFITRVYHPNIDSRGSICLDDLGSCWSPVLHTKYILTLLHTLLGSPRLDDPLVPEIAQTFIEDHERYCEDARLYTRRYAGGERPDISKLTLDAKEQEWRELPN